MATTIVAASVYSMNMTIVSISLPHMQGTFSATPDQIAWVVTGFILGLTMSVACMGWISQRFDRKKVYIFALTAFVAASVMCGNARVLEEEVLWRFLQGVSGAAILPLSQAIILDVYPPEEHSSAIGIWSFGNMAGPILAPPIGGYITETWGWPSVFDINIPAGLLCIVGAVLFIPSRPANPGRHLDVFGAVTLVAGLALIQLMVNRGGRQDWFESIEILVECLLGLFFLYLFVVHILTTRRPFIDPAMFRDRNFVGGIATITAFGLFSFLPVVMLPLFMRNLLNYPVELIGLLLVPRAIGVIIGNTIATKLSNHVDMRYVVVAGLIAIALSSWNIATWPLDVSTLEIGVNGIFQGIGNGMMWVTVTLVCFRTLSPDHRAQGVPLFFLTFNIAASIGIASMITYWVQSTQVNHSLLAEAASPFNQIFRSGLAPDAWSLKSQTGVAALDGMIAQQAGMIGFELTFQAVTLMALLTIPLIFLAPRFQKKRPP
jgi:MFS transporter, DHA2 family, multidrug resistance protein